MTPPCHQPNRAPEEDKAVTPACDVMRMFHDRQPQTLVLTPSDDELKRGCLPSLHSFVHHPMAKTSHEFYVQQLVSSHLFKVIDERIRVADDHPTSHARTRQFAYIFIRIDKRKINILLNHFQHQTLEYVV